jgi:glucose/arabinose dehydrogenase
MIPALLILLPGIAQALPQVELKPVITSGLSAPIGLTHAGDGSGRLFINEQVGRIRIYKPDSDTLLSTPFLDISDRLRSGGETGLLGVVFHPDYASNGYFYVNYSAEGNTCNANYDDTVVSRFSVSSANPDIADPDSEVCIITVHQPYGNHNGGQLAFGPDGYLYIGMGDGGDGGDPQNNGQDRSTLLGSMLRIDVNNPPSGSSYTVPADNPFVGQTGIRPEIWAWGLRNPWRFSFDRQTGDLWIGDVGQGEWEEIDFQPAASTGGENYGWACREGTHTFSNRAGCPAADMVDPIIEYPHGNECSVTGGYRYRGNRYPDLKGVYFYGDYCSGVIWGATQSGGSWLVETAHTGGFGLTTFGEDQDGEVYVIYGNNVSQITTFGLIFADGFE